MLNHVWTVLCKQSVIDQDSNNLSLYEVLEKVSLEIDTTDKSGEFAIPLEFEVVSLWNKATSEKLEAKFFLNITSPSGKNIGKTIANEIVIPKNKKRVRTRLKLKGITINDTGEYQFNIYLQTPNNEEKLMAQIPLEIDVKFIETEQ